MKEEIRIRIQMIYSFRPLPLMEEDFLKEERVAECLMSWGRLFQMWGPKCEKVRKPWVLRLKLWRLSMPVSDEERREREGL